MEGGSLENGPRVRDVGKGAGAREKAQCGDDSEAKARMDSRADCRGRCTTCHVTVTSAPNVCPQEPFWLTPSQELTAAGSEPQMHSQTSRFPVELGSVRDPDAQVGRLHRLALAGGPCWGLARLLRRVVQVDGENSAGQTGLFLSALLGHTSIVRLLLASGANPNHRCLDGSTPMHAGAFSGRGLVLWHLLQAGGDLRLHDQQGRTPRDWAEQGDAKQSWEVLELLQWCRTHMSALVQSGELAPTVSLSRLQALSGHSLCGSLPSLRLAQADRALRQGWMRRSPLTPGLGFGQLNSLQPPALMMGIPLIDPKELASTQGEPDRTYESSSQTLMANLLWKGHPVTVRQLKTPETHPDVLLADLQHCSILHHPGLLLLMALSPSEDLSRLSLLFEPVWLGSLYFLLHSARPVAEGSQGLPGLRPGSLLLQVVEALLFLQSRCWAHGGLSSHAVQLVRPGLAKVSHLEHGRPLNQPRLQSRLPQDYPQGDPGPGLPPPPELYPWLPLELIRGDMPATTSDLYSFCILTQEVFTGELPWAGGEGPEVKAKLEAGESPALDTLLPAPYQALVQAGLGLEPADRWGSLQSTRYLLRKAMAKESAPKVSSPVEWTTPSPVTLSSLPEHLYREVTPRAKARSGLVLPFPDPSQALETPEVTDDRSVQQNAAWDSGSSLTLGSSLSPSPSLPLGPSSGVEPSPSPSPSLHSCLEPTSTKPESEASELTEGTLLDSLQEMDLLEEIMAELQNKCHLEDTPRLSPTLSPDS
ncbi:inactive serine/threonine-protein kinase TEX14-like [Peromyscus leucopus]|uniref:inactive serine/threonine-protein kinase TEX14-like n=1 Tax=Peromyscus leucopus TaxID=10041 RepID=UPI0018850CEE|nr:inactive serine/threonine-protein kinase TEX14-like [Peromyscus leucopus]